MGLASVLISVNLATAVFAIVLFLYSFPHRHLKSIRLLMVMNLGCLLVAYCTTSIVVNPDLESKIFWSRVSFIGLTIVPASYLIFFSCIVSRWTWLQKRWVMTLLYLPPACVIAMTLVPEWQHLVMTNFEPFEFHGANVVKYEYGTGFAFHLSAAYFYLSLFFALCIRVILKDQGVHRKQAVILGLSMFATMAVDFYAVVTGSPLDWAMIPTVFYCLNLFAIFYTTFALDLANIVSLARRRVFDLIPDPVLVTDRTDRLVTFNRASELAFGLKRGTAINSVFEVLTAEQLKAGEQVIESKNYQLEISPVFEKNTQFTGQLYFYRDVTEQKAAERKTIELLNFSNEMLSLMSHDLSGNLHVQARLAGHVSKELPESARTLGSSLQEAASSSRDLVNNLVTWGRSLAPGLGVAISRPYELNVLCEEAIEFITPIADAQSVRVRFQPFKDSIILKGDSGVVSSAIRNLISNAIRASKAGGDVTVYVEVHDQSVSVVVDDRGVGMNAENLAKLFSSDHQQARAPKTFGYGIGLRVSQKLLETQNGRIEIESEEGRGTRATLRLQKEVSLS